MKKFILLLSTLFFLGCASKQGKPPRQPEPSIERPKKPSIEKPKESPKAPPKNMASLTQCDHPNPRSNFQTRQAELDLAANKALETFKSQKIKINTIWGKDGYVKSDRHRYVKYLNSYKTRADIHFDTGKIYVSTIDQNNTLEGLRDAIIQVILLPPEPKHIDLFGAGKVKYSETPFFLGQILDQHNKPMATKRKAAKFADYLIANKLQERKFALGTAKYVEITLAKDHEQVREYKFADQVKAASKRYNVPESLIYAVIRTESSFNPYAVSHAGAIGLMQIVPTTAGADVFKLVKNIKGIPSREYLFDPTNNIDSGVAYLSILRNLYLNSIDNTASKHLAVISAYNGGASNVLATFDNNREKATEKINQTPPRQVYCILTRHHPKKESRNYLTRVLKAQRDFNIYNI